MSTSVWTYPWCMQENGLERSFEELAHVGIDRITLAAHYHSIRTLNSRDRISYSSYRGGCFFEPQLTMADATQIDPPVNDVPGMGDPLADIVQVAHDAGIGVGAWTVCLHNTRLASDYPEYRPVDAFGNEHTHGLCPSNDDVKQYLAAIVRSLAEYDIDRIDLESIGFPGALHGHGEGFGHLKNFAATTDATRALLSQCFCSACRETAAGLGIDLDPAAERVRDLATQAVSRKATCESAAADPVALFTSDSELYSLQTVRQKVVTELVATLATASGDVPLTYYVADGLGRGVDDGITAGVNLTELGSHLDSVTALYYSNNYETLEGRIRRIRDRTDLPTEVGVTVDPSEFAHRQRWLEFVDHVFTEDPAGVNVYNYSLMADHHLDWLEALIQRQQ